MATYTKPAVRALGQRGQAMAKAYAKPAAPAKPVAPAPRPAPRPAYKDLNTQLKAVFGGDPYADEQAAIQYGWSGGLGAPEVEGGTYTAPSAAGFGGGLGGYDGASVALLSSQMGEDLGTMASSMTSKIRQALVDLGLTDREKLEAGARQYVDDPTWEAAKQNKYSLFAKLAESEAKATAQSRAQLAARGMLSSGQLTKAAQDILKDVEEKRYAGVREFSGGVGDLLSAYASRQREWASRIAQARAAAGAASGGESYDTSTGARPGEWADTPLLQGWEPWRNTDARYDMSYATPTDYGYIGPQGQRYDDKGRVI